MSYVITFCLSGSNSFSSCVLFVIYLSYLTGCSYQSSDTDQTYENHGIRDFPALNLFKILL